MTSSAGLTNMSDRLAAVGGVLVIRTAPGMGTCVSGTVPLSSNGNGSTGRRRLPEERGAGGATAIGPVRRQALTEGPPSRPPLVFAEDDDAVHDVHAQGEHGERPPRVVPADRKQGAERAEACRR